jgi:hypothetical protein
LSGCIATSPKKAAPTLPAFQDTYRWHPYRLSREAPESADGVFRLIGVSKEGTAELLYDGDTRVVVKRNPSAEELVASGMPMRITQVDFEKQSVEFEWLTTN